MADCERGAVSRFRRIGKRVGQIVTLVAVLFLAWELYRQWTNLNDWRPSAGQLGMVIAFALFYGASLMLLAYNWLTILNTLVVERLQKRPVLLSYTQTQIAKYMPGNVFHIVSRHMYLSALGLPHRPITIAVLFEIASLPIAALCAVSILSPFTNLTMLNGYQRIAFLSPIVIALILVAGVAALNYYRQRHLAWPIATVLFRATCFMLFQGLIFALILQMVSSTFVVISIPIAILAWLVGFATPGAPGGIAVREALLIKLLAMAAPEESILIAALLFRFVTTAGDLILYGFGRNFVLKTTD